MISYRLCVVKILSLKEKGSGKYNTAIPSDQLTRSQVTGRFMPAKVDGVHLKIGASNSVHEVVWEGTNCTTIDVQDSVIDLLRSEFGGYDRCCCRKRESSL